MIAGPKPIFTTGTLSYTRAGLITLFSWLIWGDFVLTLMERTLPALLPLLLKAHGADNAEIAVIVSTLLMVMNATLNPIISYKSDRFRSRWGRRRPFIIFTTPFVVFFLSIIPFAPEITHWMNSHGLFAKLLSMGPVPPLILVFGILVVGFQTFNMFVSSVYYYLIPDVVPNNLLGRFYALFRLVGALASMTFSYFIFGQAQTHMKMIFVAAALAYGFFILLMCWQVKEGEYPPPLKEDHSHWWSGIRNYAQECYGHTYYWWVFLTYSSFIWAGVSGVFMVFFYRDELGLSLDQIGKLSAATQLLFIVLVYPFGILVDRWGCHKALILGASIGAVCSMLMFFFARNGEQAIVWAILRSLPADLTNLAIAKWTVDVYPRGRYGQFGSAAALFSSIGGIILGPICGWWLDGVKHYRFILLWQVFFSILAIVTAATVYRKWKALGGPNAYRAP